MYIEWNDGAGHNAGDDAAEADYSIDSTASSFEIQARGGGGRKINIYLGGMQTLSEGQQATISLPFAWNQGFEGFLYPVYGSNSLIIAGIDGKFVCNSRNNPSVPWMNQWLPNIGGRALREICLPGSHDTGMSTVGTGTPGTSPPNCQTQTKDVAAQLAIGIRVLDIRIVISGGRYYTGHYTAPRGANGQSLSDIINQVNAFTAQNQELVILRISHDMNTDSGYRSFNQNEWNVLFNQLNGLNNRWRAPPGFNIFEDFSQRKLNEFIGGPNAAVVLVFYFDTPQFTLGDKIGRGFFMSNNFPIYDEYSESDDPNTMMNDEMKKLTDARAPGSALQSTMFNLSWTLTQSTKDAIMSPLGGDGCPSIVNLASYVNPRLVPVVMSKVNPSMYPNIIDVDYIQDTVPLAVALAINSWLV